MQTLEIVSCLARRKNFIIHEFVLKIDKHFMIVPAHFQFTRAKLQLAIRTMPRSKRKARPEAGTEQSPIADEEVLEASEFEAEAIQGFRVVAQQRQYLFAAF
jgi:hypothetical protein